MTLTPNTLAKHLFKIYSEYRLDNIGPHNCTHGEITILLRDFVARSKNLLMLQELGHSIEGRSINMVSCGSGAKKILLWSQMHGDESTATLALMDILNFLLHYGRREKWVHEMLTECTLFFIPMLNPDGAERIQRRTAVGIDMNRDAETLATPEARILRDAQRRLVPSFGFNLHDQELSSVGTSNNVTALALLAPAVDNSNSNPRVRRRAMRVAALIARTLKQFAEGHLTQYDDSYEPRAFGDGMQSWGTSTVLIESGHWPKDPQKAFIRKLNFVAILSAARAISNGSYEDVDLEWYTSLPQNGKKMYDIIIRGVLLQHASWSHRVDIGLSRPQSYERVSESTMVTIEEIGDLSTYGGLEIIDGGGRRISPSFLRVEKVLSLKDLLDVLQLYFSPV
jgi:hypothetical protein